MSDTLEVTLRKDTGTRAARRLRKEGRVPAVLYGHGEKCVDLTTTREAVEAMVRHGSRFVELIGEVKTAAVVRELQWDTFGVEPIHVDFLRVSKSDRVKVKVPIDLKGECPGQRAGGCGGQGLRHGLGVQLAAAGDRPVAAGRLRPPGDQRRADAHPERDGGRRAGAPYPDLHHQRHQHGGL